jgi:hypothetical protein
MQSVDQVMTLTPEEQKLQVWLQQIHDDFEAKITPETQIHQAPTDPDELETMRHSWAVGLVFLENHGGTCGVSPFHKMIDEGDTMYWFDMDDPRFAESCRKINGKYCDFHESEKSKIRRRQTAN